jgi:hypothetical protein
MYGRRVMEPTVGAALRAGLRVVRAESWLVVAGLGLTLFRGVLTFPAFAFVAAVSWVGARQALRGGGGMEAVASTLAHVWTSPRARSIALGLWLAGVLLWGALRVAWIAGSMPVLGWRLAGGRGPEPRFSSGAAWGFGRLLPVAVASVLLDLLGWLLVVAALLGAVAVGVRVQGTGAGGAAAFVAALAIAASAFLGASLSVLGETAVARAAVGGEAPGPALAGAVRSLVDRPSAFVLALFAVALAATLATGSVQAFLGAAAGPLRAGPARLFLVPELLLAALAALVASGAELWRLSAVAVLALGGQPVREPRRMSFRRDSLGMRPPSQ